MMITTSKGELDDSTLDYSETEEQVPAGRLVKRTYRLGDEIVKQDIEVFVTETAMESIGTGGL